ncbi:mucin-5AC [Wyeomyia smithii]|uniref:mucin-5AC n=1 Tax=Wyeomyia smithii TaxID=174621 RepID=UPI002467FB83|nr:mucin-5AC [Wyeomyia smithii]XP_055523924.1 mucin-5AC [Wyeomyia smithii]XP_055523925.1 mucin-5AC [Wyeomyia smithii]XP_055523926.1 mucin-5AC [Wyeomyia smithii]XP_055523927.1 mucin-5AC [Wyeomyia smithii]
MKYNSKMFLLATVILSTAIITTDGQFLPGPRYSLDNMPKTSFSCRDKILGGYYADSETQCQMFHVCVKVAGIGVQDFRFLCPNGTAFDQEAQICADWGDVDCEAATLYYGSNNFDLYRIGSGFESKRAPYAEEEEEATFHLQRAETSDARRSKQYIVNQSSKPQGPPVHNPNQIPSAPKPHHHHRPPAPTMTTTTSTTTSTTSKPTTTSSYNANDNYYNQQHQKQIQQKQLQQKQQQLIYNQQQQIQQQQYRQLTAAAATATPADHRQYNDIRTTTPTTFASNQRPQKQQQQQQQQPPQHNDQNNDEIFRGSHSSHFYNNRNNGKEEFDDDYVRKPTQPTTVRPLQSAGNGTRTQPRGRNRGRGSIRAHNLNIVQNEVKPTQAQKTRLQSTTPEDFVEVAKIPNYHKGSTNYRQQPTTVLQPQNGNQISFSQSPASTPAPFSRGQQRPVPSAVTDRTSSAFFHHQQTNTTPARPQQSSQNFQQSQQQQRYQTLSNSSIAASANPSTSTHAPNINFQFFNRNPPVSSSPYITTTPQSTSFQRVTQAPQFYNTGFENKATERTIVTEASTISQETLRPRAQPRLYNVDPGRLSQFNYNEYQGSRTSITTSTTTTAPTTAASEYITPSTYNPLNYRPQQQQQQHLRQHPQSFNANLYDPRTTSTTTPASTTTASVTQSRASPNERYQAISRSASDGHTPSTIKKFSTLVPKDQYNPTTFKPNAFSKKALLQFIIQKPEKPQEKNAPTPVKSTIYIPTVPPVSITTTTTTAAPVASRRQYNTYFQQPQQQVHTTTTTSSTTTTSRPTEVDEDDGQYHPELYEKDLYRNRVKAKFNQERKQSQNYFQQSTPVSQLLSTSDEDEIFRTAHSQNIVASGNDLILERARQAAAKINEFLSSSSVKPTAPAPTKKSSQSVVSSNSSNSQRVNPRPFSKAPTISPHATSTKRPSDDKEEYDYAYYDTGSPDIPEYDVIEEFGRTGKNKKQNKN